MTGKNGQPIQGIRLEELKDLPCDCEANEMSVETYVVRKRHYLDAKLVFFIKRERYICKKCLRKYDPAVSG